MSKYKLDGARYATELRSGSQLEASNVKPNPSIEFDRFEKLTASLLQAPKAEVEDARGKAKSPRRAGR